MASSAKLTDYPIAKLSGRLAYVRDRWFGGSNRSMARVSRVGDGIIRNILSDRNPDDEDVERLLQGLKRSTHTLNVEWLRSGVGTPNKSHQAEIPADTAPGNGNGNGNGNGHAMVPAALARPAATPEEADRSDRFRQVLQFLGGPVKASHVLNMDEHALAGLATGTLLPTEDDILAVLALPDCPIREDWLLTGDGEMFTSTPAPAAPPPAPAPADPLGSLLTLAEQLQGYRTEAAAAGTRAEKAAADAKALVTGELSKIRAEVREQINKALNTLASQGQVNTLGTRVDGLARRLNELGEVVDPAERIDQMAARMRGLEERLGKIGSWAEAVAALRRELQSSEEAAAETARQLLRKVDQIALDAGRRYDGLEHRGNGWETRICALEQRITQPTALLAAAKAPTAKAPADPPAAPPARPEPKVEADLNDADWTTLERWCDLPGPHQKLIRDVGDRRIAGRRLGAAVDASNLERRFTGPGAGTGPGRKLGMYPVRMVRAYARWLAQAMVAAMTTGDDPTEESWLDFWKRQKTR